jgi:hypothetical protein
MSELRFSQTEAGKELPGDAHNQGPSTISDWRDIYPKRAISNSEWKEMQSNAGSHLEKDGILPSVSMSEQPVNQSESPKALQGDNYEGEPSTRSHSKDELSTNGEHASNPPGKTTDPESVTSKPEPPKALPGENFHGEVRELPGDNFHGEPSPRLRSADRTSNKNEDISSYLEKTGILPTVTISGR